MNMKNKLLLSLIALGLIGGVCFAAEELTDEYFRNLPKEKGMAFYTKMFKCKPAKFEETTEVIQGKTRNNICRYSFKSYYEGDEVTYNCNLPMPVAVGYATSAYQILDNLDEGTSDFSKYFDQHKEIIKVMHDYCVISEK